MASAAGERAEGTEGGRTTVAGLVAGAAAGVAMAAFMMAAAAFDGADPLAPLWPMRSVFSDVARERTAATFLLGVASHLGFSALVGLAVTALLPRGYPLGASAMLGVGAALFVMAFMTSLVLPALNPTMRAAMPRFGGAWVLAHGVWGVTLGLVAQAIRHRGTARVGALRERHA